MALFRRFRIGALCQFVYTARCQMRHIVAFLSGGEVFEMRFFFNLLIVSVLGCFFGGWHVICIRGAGCCECIHSFQMSDQLV